MKKEKIDKKVKDLLEKEFETGNVIMPNTYDKAVRMVLDIFLLMLNEELSKLEKEHKTGSPYWRQLRRNKWVIQRIFEFATMYPDVKRIGEELRRAFFRD